MMNASMEQMPLPSNYGSVAPSSGSETLGRVRSMSPPPPPLPMDDQTENGSSRRRVMPHDADLPGWVPKDYIDKGKEIKNQQSEYKIFKYY